jgi:hypothetical protein
MYGKKPLDKNTGKLLKTFFSKVLIILNKRIYLLQFAPIEKFPSVAICATLGKRNDTGCSYTS